MKAIRNAVKKENKGRKLFFLAPDAVYGSLCRNRRGVILFFIYSFSIEILSNCFEFFPMTSFFFVFVFGRNASAMQEKHGFG